MLYKNLLNDLAGHSHMKIENNTVVSIKTNRSIYVRYYDTDILTVDPNGKIKLGKIEKKYRTVTTKKRLNKYLDRLEKISTVNGNWFLNNRNKKFVGGEIIQ